MGIRGHISEITPGEFQNLVQGGEPDLTRGQHYFIDKAWSDFHTVFKERGPPLSLVIKGDFLHRLSPHTLEEFFDGNHEWYMGFTSPSLVSDIAKALSQTSTTQLKEWYDELEVGGYDIDFYLFDELKLAYTNASKAGNAVMIMIA